MDSGTAKSEKCAANARFRYRGYLPHWERNRATYFVTFRLKDSLPQELLRNLNNQRLLLERARRANASVAADETILRGMQALLRKAERCLDRGLGPCHMRDSRIARIVADAIKHFDGHHYRLLAWCVMPNHVHVVFLPRSASLDSILHSWKSFSALEANRALARTGAFWQREYFDYVVRHERSLFKILRYVEENPRRAGLKNWQWMNVISGEDLKQFCNSEFQPANLHV